MPSRSRILSATGLDAPGNIGAGTSAFATASLDLPLDKLVWKGLRLKANGTLRRTQVNDPIDGHSRPFSGFYPAWGWDGELGRGAGQPRFGVAGPVGGRAGEGGRAATERHCAGDPRIDGRVT